MILVHSPNWRRALPSGRKPSPGLYRPEPARTGLLVFSSDEMNARPSAALEPYLPHAFENHPRPHAGVTEAAATGDPSLLRDGLTPRERIALETFRDARAAMALIREAIEDCAPPGSVEWEGYLAPEFTVQAEALVRGIYAIALSRKS
jgi:hypothetical protein